MTTARLSLLLEMQRWIQISSQIEMEVEEERYWNSFGSFLLKRVQIQIKKKKSDFKASFSLFLMF